MAATIDSRRLPVITHLARFDVGADALKVRYI